MTNIMEMDAILAYDEDGNPREPHWPEADVIVGNPPFLGSRKMRPTLGDGYCDALQEVYKGRVDGLPDLVCYWFERARSLIADGGVERAGLLATQAIRMGSNRRVLENIKRTGDIFMAWSDRPWVLNGASVRVSMVGFDHGREENKVLDDVPVLSINSNLTADIDLSAAKILVENESISFQGVVTRGPFEVSPQEAEAMLAEVGNPNGRPNSDVIRPRRNAMDITRRSKDMYVIDFGVDMTLEDAALYEAPFEHVRTHVYPMRQKANQAVAREKWWLHWNPRPRMRSALFRVRRYIATPRVAKHRIFVWLDSRTDQVPTAYRAEGRHQAVEGALMTMPPMGGIVRFLESRR